MDDKIKMRKLLPILPGLLTPSEVASEIIHPEVGLQVNHRDILPDLTKTNNFNIQEITDSGFLNNNENTSHLEERIIHLEKSNQRLAQALYALSSRVSSVETFNSCNRDNNIYRPMTSKSNFEISSASLMDAMKISNELISELSQRVRKSELAIDAIEFKPMSMNPQKVKN